MDIVSFGRNVCNEIQLTLMYRTLPTQVSLIIMSKLMYRRTYVCHKKERHKPCVLSTNLGSKTTNVMGPSNTIPNTT